MTFLPWPGFRFDRWTLDEDPSVPETTGTAACSRVVVHALQKGGPVASQSPYDDLIMDHIRNARNYRALDDADRKCRGSNPLCGDEVDIYLKLERDRIEDASFQCTCCGISMASASMMTEAIKGRSPAEALSAVREVVARINRSSDVADKEGNEMQRALVATVREFPARARCATLPWITLEAALAGQPEAGFS